MKDNTEIQKSLIDGIRNGRAVLVLGSGASKGAKDKHGKDPPTAKELAALLADHFLGQNYQNEPLNVVSELAISATSLGEVQDYIADIFHDLKPAWFHQLIPTFKWWGIATTNYDLILENAYETTEDRVQELSPMLSDRDKIEDIIRSPSHVAYLKLHGCISRTHDETIPLILTSDQLLTYKSGRKRLFTTLYEWGNDHPIVFVGHSLSDYSLRSILLELDILKEWRPHYFLVTPSPRKEIIDFWNSKRITIIDRTLEEFLAALDREITKEQRSLQKTELYSHPIEEKIETDQKLSSESYQALTTDIEYVHPDVPVGHGTPKQFYRGFGLGWYPIQENWDVRRHLIDTLLLEVIMRSDKERSSIAEICAIKAEAGAGKTTLIKRLAWEATIDVQVLCLFLRDYGRIYYETLADIYRVTRQRLFLFVDNAADHVQELQLLIERAIKEQLPLTIITAERINEWNIACEILEKYVTQSFQLPYLNKDEIESLLDLLDQHDSLGDLKGVSREQQIDAFEKRAGRQLLVALHEVTLGRPFEDILVDEYNQIRPQPAQHLYLTVCVLNRLNVPVRAGLISRIHHIPFEEFCNKLFKPLEHVVQVEEDMRTKSQYYTARHPEIAEIVFERIITDPEDRFNEYIHLLANMNLSYKTDRVAFRQLIKGRTLLALFPDHNQVIEIFKVAEEIDPRDSHILHQKAIYEMHRPNGNLSKANEYLKHAQLLDLTNSSIVHSLAELAFIRMERARTDYEKNRYRDECKKLAVSLLQEEGSKKYARHTLIKVSLEELTDLLKKDESQEQQIDTLVRRIEKLLDEGFQESPFNPYLYPSEIKFRALLKEDKKVMSTLEKAFEVNRRDTFVVSSLAKVYTDKGDKEKACKVLEKALEADPANKAFHFRYAILLVESNEENQQKILYHLKRSFTKWDRNLEAQFWFARYAYESEDQDTRKLGDEIFHRFRETPLMSYDERTQVKTVIKKDDKESVFTGVLKRKEDTYGFMYVDGKGDRIFVHKNNVEEEIWKKLSIGMRCSFNIGFAFSGPIAINVEPRN